VLKRLRSKVRNIAIISLILTMVLLLVFLVIIDGVVATWIFSISGVIVATLNKLRPEAVDQTILRWNNMTDLAHWGLITLGVSGIIYFIIFFIKNYDIQIVPKNNNLNTNEN